jgi:hypothetical protein
LQADLRVRTIVNTGSGTFTFTLGTCSMWLIPLPELLAGTGLVEILR